MAENLINHQKGPDLETVKHVHPYLLRSTYSSSFMDLMERSDVLQLVNIGQKYQKRGITGRKRAKIENPYLNEHLQINMNSHI